MSCRKGTGQKDIKSMFCFLRKAHSCSEGWDKTCVKHWHLLIYHARAVWNWAFCAHHALVPGGLWAGSGRWEALHGGRNFHPPSQKSLRGHRPAKRLPVSWKTQRPEEGGTNSANPEHRDVALGCSKFWPKVVQVKTAQEDPDFILLRGFFQ